MLLDNHAESGTQGTTVSTANSASPDAWDAVSIGTGGTFTFDSLHLAHGSLGFASSQGTTTVAIYGAWTTKLGTLTTTTVLFGRMYLWFAAIPATNTPIIGFFNGTTALAYVSIQTGTGKLQFRDGTNSGVGVVGGTAISLSTIVRVEFTITGLGAGATGGSGTAKWAAGDSVSFTGTDSTASGVNFGSAICNGVRFGAPAAGWTKSTSWYFDDCQINDTGYPGPYSAAATKVQQPSRSTVAVQQASTWCRRKGQILVPDLWTPGLA